jgi:hypothetical protein
MIIKLRLVTLEEILPPYAAVVAHTAENAAAFVEHDRAIKFGYVACVHYQDAIVSAQSRSALMSKRVELGMREGEEGLKCTQ